MTSMSKKILVFAIIFLSFHQGANSADAGKRRRNHDISINPLMMFQYTLPLTYHLAISDGTALGLGLVAKHNGNNYWSFGGALSMKLYLSNTVFEDSWYVEPRADISYNNYSSNKYWSITPSAMGGHTWVWASGFTLNLGLGLSFPIPFVDRKIFGNESWHWGLSGIQPTGEFSLGWAF